MESKFAPADAAKGYRPGPQYSLQLALMALVFSLAGSISQASAQNADPQMQQPYPPANGQWGQPYQPVNGNGNFNQAPGQNWGR